MNIRSIIFVSLAGGISTFAGTAAAQPVTSPEAPVEAQSTDPAAVAHAQDKLAHAQQVAARFADQAKAQRLDDAWRFTMISDLMRAPESQFQRVAGIPDLMHALGASASLAQQEVTGAHAKELGNATTDLSYIPINPCRILDTRQGSAFAAGQTNSYTFKSANVGHATNCSVFGSYSGSQYPAALAVNVTVDETGLTGFPVGKFLAIYPDGGTLGASFMNFGPGDIIANAGVITINEATGLFNIKSSAPAQVIIDVFGVFVAPLPTPLQCTDVTSPQTVSVAGGVDLFPTPACPAGYAFVSAICDGKQDSAIQLNVQGSLCGWSNLTGTAHNVAVGSHCCQVPGRQ